MVWTNRRGLDKESKKRRAVRAHQHVKHVEEKCKLKAPPNDADHIQRQIADKVAKGEVTRIEKPGKRPDMRQRPRGH